MALLALRSALEFEGACEGPAEVSDSRALSAAGAPSSALASASSGHSIKWVMSVGKFSQGLWMGFK